MINLRLPHIFSKEIIQNTFGPSKEVFPGRHLLRNLHVMGRFTQVIVSKTVTKQLGILNENNIRNTINC